MYTFDVESIPLLFERLYSIQLWMPIVHATFFHDFEDEI